VSSLKEGKMARALLIPALLLVCPLSIILGLFLFFNPAAAIETQRKIYEKINWRIEPMSMQKELRNTRGMGLALIAAAAFAVICILIKIV
jgi:hypothetical protein